MNPKCRICKTPTEVGFNINLDLVPICESCATSIFIQQASWFVKENRKNKKVQIKDEGYYCSCNLEHDTTRSTCRICGKPYKWHLYTP